MNTDTLSHWFVFFLFPSPALPFFQCSKAQNEVTCKKKKKKKIQKVKLGSKVNRSIEGDQVMIRWAQKDIRKNNDWTMRRLSFFFFGRHGDMLGKRWANRNEDVLGRKQGRGQSYTQGARAARLHYFRSWPQETKQQCKSPGYHRKLGFTLEFAFKTTTTTNTRTRSQRLTSHVYRTRTRSLDTHTSTLSTLSDPSWTSLRKKK